MMPALRTVDDLTPEAVTALLQPRFPGASVSRAEATKVHQGTSTHVHLDLTYAGDRPDGAPDQVFIKTQLTTVDDLPEGFTEALGDGGGAVSMLLAEQAFYRDVAPALDVETLDVYASESIAGPGQFVIVTENVTTRGAVFPDPAQPQSPDQVAALLRNLAVLHAAGWDSARLRAGGDLAHLDSPTTGPFTEFLREGGWEIIRMLLQVPYKAKLLEEAGLDADLAESAFWQLQDRLAEGTVTLLHGDPHPGNVYVLPDGSVGVLDWQLVRRGSWAHDVGYAIVAALDPAVRADVERDLLAGYLADLEALGVTDAPHLDEAWETYCGTPLWGFAMWSITPGEMYSDELVEAVLTRFSVAVRELDSVKVVGR